MRPSQRGLSLHLGWWRGGRVTALPLHKMPPPSAVSTQWRRCHTPAPARSAAAPKLNPFSLEVRRILAGKGRRARTGQPPQHPPLGPKARGDEETEETEEGERAVLAALMAHPSPITDAALPEKGNSSPSPLLHPLLCIRILAYLGHPRLPTKVRGKGWLVRHSRSGASEEEWQRVFEHVLLPLQPLLGTAAAHSTPRPADGASTHPQLRPVLPLALSWWCFYRPTPRASQRQPQPPPDPAKSKEGNPLSADVWLPHLVSFYSERSGGTADDDWSPLSLPFLLPYLVSKTHSTEEDHLTAVLGLCLSESVAEADAAQEGAVVVSSPSALVDSLFWAAAEPLLSQSRILEGLRRATPGRRCLTFRIGIDSDDTLRRFLLRMSALMTRQRALKHQREPEGASFLIFVEPYVGREESDSLEDAEDNILRWANPLHDFISAMYEAAPAQEAGPRPAAMVQLSFAGVLNILTAILDRLQTMRNASSCNQPANMRSTEHCSPPNACASSAAADHQFTLLPHKPRVHAVKRTCEILLHHARHLIAATTAAGAPSEPWFRDIPVPQQEAVLRRLCGASRALVRVVMEEKRVSLLTEGPEGSALTAGGAFGSPPRLAKERHQPPPAGPVLTHHHHHQPASSSASSLTAVSLALRNTAFRVLEPALWRLYCADISTAMLPSAPSSLPILPSLSTLLRLGLMDILDSEGVKGYLVGQPDAETWLAEALDAVSQVHRDVGGVAAWETASQLLQHPLQQPAVAVLEGVRLLALQVLLFPSLLPRTSECLRVTVERYVLAVQSVWDSCGGAAAGADPGTGEEAMCGGLTPLQVRLAFLSLLVLVRRGTAEAASAEDHRMLDRACSSLLHLLTGDGAFGTEWSVLGLHALLPEGRRGEEAAVSFAPTGLHPANTLSRWELLEELRELHLCSASSSDAAATVWEWLGSPAAVVRAAAFDAPAPGEVRYYLIPWTTLAESRQPLRLYDESGQSGNEAAARFDHHLQRLLSLSQTSEAGAASAVVVRFVSVAEELGVFAEVASQVPEMRLAEDVVIRNAELRLARELCACARQGSHNARPRSFLFEEETEGEEEYDGLD